VARGSKRGHGLAITSLSTSSCIRFFLIEPGLGFAKPFHHLERIISGPHLVPLDLIELYKIGQPHARRLRVHLVAAQELEILDQFATLLPVHAILFGTRVRFRFGLLSRYPGAS
jgi:hypothetical protein